MAKPPTARQLRYLRALAARSGTTFTPPGTRRGASRAIKALQSRRPSKPWERHADALSVAEHQGAHTATDIRGDEIAGYGANARWRHGS